MPVTSQNIIIDRPEGDGRKDAKRKAITMPKAMGLGLGYS